MSETILQAYTALTRGNMEHKNKQVKNAIESYKKSVDLFKEAKQSGIELKENNLTNFTNAYVNLGAVLIEDKQPNEAVKYFSYAIDQKISTFAIHYGLGSAYLNLKKYDLAIDALTAASKLDNKKPEVYYNLGLAHKLNNDNAQAIPYFQQAKTLSFAKDFDTLYNLGVCLEAKKDQGAVGVFKEALAATAEPKTLLSTHCKIVESQIRVQAASKTLQSDLKTAFDYANKMSEADKNNPEHKDYLNFIVTHFGKLCLTVSDETSKDITKAMELYKTVNHTDKLAEFLKADAEFMFNDPKGSKKTAIEILTRLDKYCKNNQEVHTAIQTTLVSIAINQGKDELVVKIGENRDYSPDEFGFNVQDNTLLVGQNSDGLNDF